MDKLQQQLHDHLGIGPTLQEKIFFSLLAVVVIILIRLVIIRITIRSSKNSEVVYQWRKHTGRVAFVIALVILSAIWMESMRSLSTFLGLFSAGVAIALKDLLTNLAGWLFIVWRKPFQVGDRIEVDKIGGDVIDIRIFQFTLMEIGNWVDADQSTGRMMHLPNGSVFNKPFANFTSGFNYIWNEIGVLVTFESDWQRAEQILREIADEHLAPLAENAVEEIRQAAYQYMITYKTLTPNVYVTVKDSGVMLTIRYLCRPRTRRGTQEQVWKAILTQFAEHDNIDFAYPTHRFYNNAVEGKPGTRPATIYGRGDTDS